MNGGKVLWLIEEARVNSDSLFSGETVALYQPLGVEDQLFRYGARINPSVIQDIECAPIRLSVRSGTGSSQIVPFPWFYYPLLRPSSKHPVTRNLNRVKGQYTNYIDTVGLDPAIKKTVLLETSERTRIMNPPFVISLKEAENAPDQNNFNRAHLPVAILLDGVFPSAFRNRMVSNLVNDRSFRIKAQSKPTRMIVVADADIIRNDVRREGKTLMPFPLGQDRVSGVTYGNSDFIVNCINYLTDENNLMELRSRELKMRLLNRGKIKNEKLKWQVINIAGPVLLVLIAGLIYNHFRKKIYSGSMS
jgi:ABC-2 type transport system permease protein